MTRLRNSTSDDAWVKNWRYSRDKIVQVFNIPPSMIAPKTTDSIALVDLALETFNEELAQFLRDTIPINDK
jgi:hypothetical protein